MSLLQASLSLPGIAGIVLTIGMAADANVLIYERIREELRLGNSPQAAITRGLRQGVLRHCGLEHHDIDRRYRAVCVRHRSDQRLRRDADARHHHLALYGDPRQPRADPRHLGSSSAPDLAAGVTVRKISKYSQPWNFFARRRPSDFMAKRKWAYAISAVLIVGSFALLAIRGLNFGIDFTGGVVLEVNYPQAVDIDRARAALATGGIPRRCWSRSSAARGI